MRSGAIPLRSLRCPCAIFCPTEERSVPAAPRRTVCNRTPALSSCATDNMPPLSGGGGGGRGGSSSSSSTTTQGLTVPGLHNIYFHCLTPPEEGLVNDAWKCVCNRRASTSKGDELRKE
ncbi:unnamed protein product [Pleuronectes platessa]|uniref:Uncharacterized protein n=1 Tax=Pleuronectes platessa TaxID=8262 RepID=A0A9N7Z698_PLEPL|nr:unnamed protein product [Pleuronectes platessa]